MKKMLQQPAWVWIAFAAILGMWLFSAAWNFGHAYVLAGGDNPMILFEGRLPIWNGPALAVAFAAVAADIMKATAGFLLIAACTNQSLNKWARGGAFVLALIVVIPTFAWSARSAMGMVALVFGDTIANRGNEQMVTRSLRDQIEFDQGRLGFLAKQTTTTRTQQLTNAKEANDLRRELEKNRQVLRESKGIGGADPGGAVLANLMGMSEKTISNWTIFLFIAMVEICSTLGFPTLYLATRAVGSTPAPAPQPKVTKNIQKSDDDINGNSNPLKDKGISGHLNGGQTLHSAPEISTPATSQAVTDKEAGEPEDEEKSDDLVILNSDEDRKPSIVETMKPSRAKHRKGKRGRPPHASADDLRHIEAYIDVCASLGFRPGVDYPHYKTFCHDAYLKPMSASALRAAVERHEELGREKVRKWFGAERSPKKIDLYRLAGLSADQPAQGRA